MPTFDQNPVFFNIQKSKTLMDEEEGKTLFEQNYHRSFGGTKYSPADGYTKDPKAWVGIEYSKALSYGTMRVYGDMNGPYSNTYRQLMGTLRDRILTDIAGKTKLSVDGKKVEVHNQKIHQPPIALYTYAGGSGEFLSIDITINEKKDNGEASQSTTVNPATKTIETTTTQLKKDQKKVPIPKEGDPNYARWKKIYDREFKKRHDDYFQPRTREELQSELESSHQATVDEIRYINNKLKETFDQSITEAEKSGDYTNLLSPVAFSEIIVKRKGRYKEVVDIMGGYTGNISTVGGTPPGFLGGGMANAASTSRNMAINALKNQPGVISVSELDPSHPDYYKYGKEGTLRPVVVVREGEIEIPLNGQRIMANANPSVINAAIAKANAIESASKEVEGDLKVVGNPSLVNSKVIELQNLSSIYSGKWYIKKAKHIINNGGYITNCSLTQNNVSAVISQTNATINTVKLYRRVHQLSKYAIDNRIDEKNHQLEQSVYNWTNVVPNEGRDPRKPRKMRPEQGVAWWEDDGKTRIVKNAESEFTITETKSTKRYIP